MTNHRLCAWNLAIVFVTCGLLTPRVSTAQYIDLAGTQPGGLDSAAPLDSAQSCGLTCHYSGDPTMPTVMPFDGYVGSMMGNTLRDPLFLAALTVAEQDHTGVGDYCLRCHTPPGFLGGRTRGTPTAALGSQLSQTDREGVTCDICHRMDPSTTEGNAQLVISPTEVRFGLYDTIDSIRHPGAASAFIEESRLCGSCHEIANPLQPLLRADGSNTGQRFPLDTTYQEWLNSDFALTGSLVAKTCQDCHMPDSDGQGYVATNTTALLRDHPARHEFSGANAWALRVLGAMRLDVASGDFYDPTLAPYYENGALRAEASLRTAVVLEMLTAPPAAVAGDRVDISVRITNHAGHRVPSGYADGRRVWLTVDLTDADGLVTSISGAYDDAAAHLDLSDPQLRVYEAVHGRIGAGHDGHLALTNTILRDTRLPPSGFHPPAGLEPVGADYSGGAGGSLRNWDDAHYSFTIPPTARGPVTVRVRARYQTTTREYVETLASANHTDSRGTDLLAAYEASGRDAPFEMAAVSTQIMVTPPIVDAGTDATTHDAAGSDGGMIDEGVPRRDACGCRTAGNSRGRTGIPAVIALVVLAVGVSRRRAPTAS